MRELAVQSLSDTYNTTDRAALDTEFDALKAEITRISDRTDFNGTSVLNPTATIDLQVGADTGDTISFTFKDMDAASIGGTPGSTASVAGTVAVQNHTFSTAVAAGESVSFTHKGNTYSQDFTTDAATTMNLLADTVVASEPHILTKAATTSATKLAFTASAAPSGEFGVAKVELPLSNDDISTKVGAVNAIDSIDTALLELSNYRGDLGATANRLTHTVDNLMNRIENTSAARSRIENTDFASESASLAKSQVLQQAGTAMLAQANASGQSVMSLLK